MQKKYSVLFLRPMLGQNIECLKFKFEGSRCDFSMKIDDIFISEVKINVLSQIAGSSYSMGCTER